MRTQANECADVQNVMSYVVDLPLLERNGKYNGNVIDMINRDYAAGDAAMNVVSTWTSCWCNTNKTCYKQQDQVA